MNHEGKQSLHPFFAKPLRNKSSLEDLHTNETPVDDPNQDADYEQPPTSGLPEKTRRKRTRKTQITRGQASLEQFTRLAQVGLKDAALNVSSNGDSNPLGVEEDEHQEQRKRRKTVSPGAQESRHLPVQSLDQHQQLEAEVQGHSLEQLEVGTAEPDALLRYVTPPPPTIMPSSTLEPIVAHEQVQHEAPNTTPKKQIRVTKTGKLVSSPPKPKPDEASPPKKRRGRKPAKATTFPTVTIIKYGSDSASRHTIGGRIEAILSGRSASDKRLATPKKGPPKIVGPPRSTHPFFMGKAGQKAEIAANNPATEQRPPTPRKSAVTPGKLRAEAQRDRSPGPSPAFGMSSGINRIAKQAGFRAIVLRDDEEILSRLTKDLATDIRQNRKTNVLDFAPPENVRLPTRVLTTGLHIQRKVCEQIQLGPSPGNKYVQLPVYMHPAITNLFNDIERTLTPFDEGRCESQTWAQKYSPKCAAHVLRTGKEAKILKDWLQSQTVMSVGGAHDPSKAGVSDDKRPPRKKRKKVVDDFIVSDGDGEDEEMIELSDNENYLGARSCRQPRWTRNKNVILLSGPHGCGKSATVYAIAKELDFEVFEMNSGMRRSGKDIQDKVGDMTANHLVNHKRPEAPAKEEFTSTDEVDTERMDSACQKDIDSGRQSTVMSFFKAGPTLKATPKVNPKVQEIKKEQPRAAQGMLPHMPASRKSQKQSLILFEEADILFEEDQQFWVQVAKLAALSKRPIIITCNDERQIPIQDLPLAAILRLRPVPENLATDYMLALAGREGHILERRAVADLYTSKNHDLRASITELDLWCQMSVGDRKGGLEWMYQRWPPGKDVNAQGRLLRVASEGTYQSGMGWLSHDIFETKENIIFDEEEELLHELWADWNISPDEVPKHTSPLTKPMPIDRLTALEDMDAFSETLSAADVYCRVGLPSHDRNYSELTDATIPPMSEKARLSYTLAAPLLQVAPQTDFLDFDTSMFIQTHLLAQRSCSATHKIESRSDCQQPTTEANYVKMLLKVKENAGEDYTLHRYDFANALDVLAAPPDTTLLERTSFNLMASSFDRTFGIITLDLAPYVRSIVAHEQILEAQRIRLSNLLSGGGTGKRARTTRASRVALEGGVRETKRRDRWFDEALNFDLVMATAGESWSGLGWKGDDADADAQDGTGSMTGTHESLTGSQDVVMQD
ncbi:P-loop containing nucleoside triphosphate hydrolase protein [Setomelanomma holmii]|uniref:P-loop containing nucleoside triphosphate hydrolase protein n=1 Tax=Setomelanomma holmii TaxID=210430 RepID=A0A9P4HAM7_9PLEO|nr:P-loop containing nucleoside triphosphate hydrolase protein [Setomelanomma holmii]